MADETVLVADSRDTSGTGAARRLRRDGKLPGILYGHGSTPRTVTLDAHTFEQMLRHHSSDNVIVGLQFEDQKEPQKVLLRDVQRDPISGRVIHADFLEIKMTEKLHVTTSIALIGEPIGVSQDGGMLDHLLRDIEIECLPGDMVERIEVDVANMSIGESVLVRDLEVDPKLTILTDGEVAVACVLAPRVDTTATAEDEEQAAEGEGEKPEGEEKEAEGDQG
jgi:large subunit ribosomal protein L25